MGIRVILDPGGIEEKDYSELLKQNIFLLKPNEHEAKILTGIAIRDESSAKQAAEKLISMGVKNVCITLGAKGAYVFNKNLLRHIPVRKIQKKGTKDETGCGDQTMAAFVFAISKGKDIESAARLAILAGTLQFYNPGITPVTRKQIQKYM